MTKQIDSQAILALAARAEKFDGFAPFNEATVLALNNGDQPAIAVQLDAPGDMLVAAALSYGDAPVELVVDPKFRLGGLGRTLLDSVLAEGATQFWAHGNVAAAQALARVVDLAPVRSLLVLRRTLTAAPPVSDAAGVTMRGFIDEDTDALIEVNARAFASHPEQGQMDHADFARRRSSAWFDPRGLIIAIDETGRLVGFHWTKIEGTDDAGLPLGEVYVVGVDPTVQSRGLGRALTAQGLRYMWDQGVRTVDLYVESDNGPALAVYYSQGFATHTQDTLYQRPSVTG